MIRRSQRNRSNHQLNLDYGQLENRQLLATLTVDISLDSTGSTSDGRISLREAIIAANTDAPFGDAPAGHGNDRIEFAPHLTGKWFPLEFGALTISDGITISGDITIDADHSSRIFSVETPERVLLDSIRLWDGQANVGGGIWIDEGGFVALEDVTFTDNRAISGSGGAVFNNGGRLTVEGSSFRWNRGFGGRGGGIYSLNGRTIVSDTTFNHNEANISGGAVHLQGGSGQFTNNSFWSNGFDPIWASQLLAPPRHGGAFALDSGARAVVTDSLFRENVANIGGGAVANFGGQLLTVDSVFEANSVNGTNPNNSGGGAIYSTGNTKIVSTYDGPVDVGEFRSLYRHTRTIERPIEFDSNLSRNASGGAILAQAGTLTLTGRNLFMHNDAGFNGGAISAYNTSVRMFDTVTYRNEASRGGGVYLANSPAFFHSVKLNGNQAEAEGGGVFASWSSLTVRGTSSMIVGNSAEEEGGGVAFVGGGTLDLTGTSDSPIDVYGNVAGDSGGGINVDGGTFTANHVTFTQNQAGLTYNSGGGLAINDANATISNARFHRNSGVDGGGMSVARRANVSITDSRFTGNNADSSGGALFIVYDSRVSVTDSSFGSEYNGNYGRHGSAIANFARLDVSDSSFYGNANIYNDRSHYGGGAIRNYGTANVEDSWFSTNLVTGQGGAIKNSGYLHVNSSFFENNQAYFLDSGADGGAIYSSSGTVSVADSTFRSNLAYSGGAIAVTRGELYVRDSRFGGTDTRHGNLARPWGWSPEHETSQFNGGAVYLEGDVFARISGTRFQHNSAGGDGGAIAIQNANGQSPDVLIRDNSVFQSNSTAVFNSGSGTPLDPQSRNGGAISNYGGQLEIRDSVFALNHGVHDGGALFNDEEGELILRAVELVNNQSDQTGGAVFNDNELLIIDSLVFGNVASESGGLADGNNGETISIDTTFIDNDG
ncbi:MAG: hypothetical protein AAF456_24795 [Planctomycetota bacterium]